MLDPNDRGSAVWHSLSSLNMIDRYMDRCTHTYLHRGLCYATWLWIKAWRQLDTVRPNVGVAEYTVSTRECCACRERKWRGFHTHNGKQTELLLIKQMRPRAIPCHKPWDLLRLSDGLQRSVISLGLWAYKERPRSRENTVLIFCRV